MSNQYLTTLQAGISVQRIMYGGDSTCPCMTIMNTQFTNQDLSYRAFVNMTLIHDTFTGCTLNSTNFTKSTFAQCLFQTCTGVSPTFFQVSMSDVSFNHCSLTNAPWNGSWLQNVVFVDTDLTNNSFTDANLNQVVFDPSTIVVGCVFNDAKIHSSQLEGLELAEHLWFKNVIMDKCSLVESQFPQIQLLQATMTECDYSLANLSQANCENATLIDCNFTESALNEANFFNANLTSCIFEGADLDSVDMTGATLFECNMINVVFGENASFSNAEIDSCNFDGADLTGVDFESAKLSSVTALGTIFVNANFSTATILDLSTNDETVFDNSRFINSTLSEIVFQDVTMQSCEFGHANLSKITFTSQTNLSNVMFTDCEMDRVNFVEVNLDGVIFDQARLSHVDMTGASLIAASFVGSTLTNVDLVAAVLSASTCPLNDDAKVAAKFESAKLTRVSITNGAYLRYTVFSGSTLVQCTFFGSSFATPDYVNLSETNFDNVVISDTVFQWCNLNYASFSNAKLSRVKFVGCSMQHAEVSNVVPEYCTADTTTILPRTWQRDPNGWIYIDNPGPVSPEEAFTLSVAMTNGQYRSYQTLDEKKEEAGTYVVKWYDGTSSDATNLLKLITGTTLIVGDAVFVRVSQGSNANDNYYVHGALQSLDSDTTCTVVFYTDVDATGVPNVQLLTDVFAEYFEYGKQVTVGLFQEKFYRWIKSLDDSGKYATWWDGTTTTVGSLKQLAMVRPILVQVGQPIFVLIKTDSSSMNDDQFLYGSVSADNGDGTYEITYASGESATAPTTQSINHLYTEVV